jgi:hypothetical protein
MMSLGNQGVILASERSNFMKNSGVLKRMKIGAFFPFFCAF